MSGSGTSKTFILSFSIVRVSSELSEMVHDGPLGVSSGKLLKSMTNGSRVERVIPLKRDGKVEGKAASRGRKS